ncbi:hypothetical protein DFH27DRAFT_603036 [Peziza echinospora]|nr:hypothetical protein DFH27DRAFT_603036 [Peziza echinospora]
MGKRTREAKAAAPAAAPMSAFAARQARAAAEASAAAAPPPQPPAAPAPAPAPKAIAPVVLNALPNVESTRSKKPRSKTASETPQETSTPSSRQRSVEKDVAPKYEFESALQRRFRQQQEAAVAAAAAVAVPGLAGDEQEDDDRMSIDEEEVTPEQRRTSATVTPRTAPVTAPTATPVSNFNPTADNYTSIPGTATTFKLRSRETLVIQGEYTLRVLAGTVSIYGTTLGSESGTNVVYAPITHALPVIEALKSERRRLDGEKFDAIISVGCSNSGLKDVGRICPLFGRIWRPPGVESEDTFYPLLKVTPPSPLPQILTISKQWKQLLSKLAAPPSDPSSPPIIILTGSKSTGKSTFSRLLLNSLLTTSSADSGKSTTTTYSQVAYLDLDPGQPEFSPPGIISLTLHTSPIFGPPFTHPSGPWHRAHHIGYITPREDPSHYIACIRDLLSSYHALPSTNPDFPLPPLVINMSGYIKGTGMEILNDVIGISAPSDLVLLTHDESQFLPQHKQQSLSQGQKLSNPSTSSLAVSIPALLATSSPATSFHGLTTPIPYVNTSSAAPTPGAGTATSSNSIPITSSGGAATVFTPADLRALQISSYFHHHHHHNNTNTNSNSVKGKNALSKNTDQQQQQQQTKRWTFTTGPLTHQPPYFFPRRRDSVRYIRVLQGEGIPPAMLPQAIEGLLVGVVRTGDGSDSEGSQYQQCVDPCVALALVRYFDPPPQSAAPAPQVEEENVDMDHEQHDEDKEEEEGDIERRGHGGYEEDKLQLQALQQQQHQQEGGTFHLVLPPDTDPDSWFTSPSPSSSSPNQALALVRGRLDVPAYEVVFDPKLLAEFRRVEKEREEEAGEGGQGGEVLVVPWLEYNDEQGGRVGRGMLIGKQLA